MNFDQNKFGNPFNAGNQYFSQLSSRIQQRVGIEVQKIGNEQEKKIDFSKKTKPVPVQLTVEFGFPLTAEKIEREEPKPTIDATSFDEDTLQISSKELPVNDIGEIHIEPLNILPNATPYWHEFNADDELEGLILDSEGQEMSDITIAGEGTFDLDQQIFHEINQNERNESPLSNELHNDIDSLYKSDESIQASLSQQDSSLIGDETTSNIISNDSSDENLQIQRLEIEAQFSLSENDEKIEDIVSFDIANDVSETLNEVINLSTESDEMISRNTSSLIEDGSDFSQVTDNQTDEVPSFSFSFIPELNEAVEEGSPVELEFSSADLDAIHEKMSAQEMSPKKMNLDEVTTPISTKTEVELEFSDADLDMLHSQMANEPVAVFEQSATGKTINIPVFEDMTGDDAEKVTPTILDMIPWSSIFGVVASLMAIASAWFIWNSIQKPIAIDEFIDKAVVTNPKTTANAPVSVEQETYLNPAEYIATGILDELTNESANDEMTFKFSELSERSKVSAVELEKLGLTSLDLEDNFFEGTKF